MLRLTTRIDYGVRALVRLAMGENTVMTAHEISEKEHVPIQFLEQIMVSLRRAGIVKSVRGPGGGYTLTKHPSDVSLLEVFKILEGPLALVKCLDPSGLLTCEHEAFCTVRVLFNRLQDKLEKMLSEISLSDLVAEAQETGVIS